MAELPEIYKYGKQMNDTLKGKKIADFYLLQEKCSNVSEAEFKKRVAGASVERVYNKGKWILTTLDNKETILLSLGMGADVLYYENADSLPEKYQVRMHFTDGSGYTIRFWWFGKYLLVPEYELSDEPNTKDIGVDPFDEKFTPDYFKNLLRGKKTGVKAFLMNQKNVSGIGNMYMHDILFMARLHPAKKISAMKDGDIDSLYAAITGLLKKSYEMGTFAYESDIFGKKGSYGMDNFLVGYKEGKPCPVCGELIIQIKAGSSSTFICPKCQKAD